MARHNRNRRALQPRLEAMERRELMSGLVVALSAHRSAPALVDPGRISIDAGTGGTSGGGNPSSGAGFSPLFGQGAPTPHELARQHFRAVFRGPVLVSQGRFSDQAKIIYIRGVGGSNFFLHGNFNLGIAVPVDPTAQVTGTAVLNDKNNNGAGILGLDLVGNPGDVDSQGRPNHLTFANNSNIYSGIFFVNTSSGTVDIHYSGRNATVVFNGFVYTAGLTNPLRNADLTSRDGRIHPRSV